MASGSDTHLIQWDVSITRQWHPLYFLGGDRAREPVPPHEVRICATFDDNAAALAFETAVRDILEGMA